MTTGELISNGNVLGEFPPDEFEQVKEMLMSANASYLKKHTEALVKDVGLEAACALTGKSKATLGRYYSDSPEHADRFMPVDAGVRMLRITPSLPHTGYATPLF